MKREGAHETVLAHRANSEWGRLSYAGINRIRFEGCLSQPDANDGRPQPLAA